MNDTSTNNNGEDVESVLHNILNSSNEDFLFGPSDEVEKIMLADVNELDFEQHRPENDNPHMLNLNKAIDENLNINLNDSLANIELQNNNIPANTNYINEKNINLAVDIESEIPANIEDEIEDDEIIFPKNNNNKPILEIQKDNKAQNTDYLSPISLSPSSVIHEDSNADTENNNTQIKIEEIENPPTVTQIKTDTKPTKEDEFNILAKNIQDMKRRILTTNELLLNFTYVKNSYSKISVNFKNSIKLLQKSELDRTHLISKNKSLKKDIANLTDKLAKYEKLEEHSEIGPSIE